MKMQTKMTIHKWLFLLSIYAFMALLLVAVVFKLGWAFIAAFVTIVSYFPVSRLIEAFG